MHQFAIPRFGRTQRFGRMGRRGTVLIFTLGVLIVLSVMGTSFALLMRTERQATVNYLYGVRAKLIAKDGILRATAELQTLLARNNYTELTDLWAFGVVASGTDYVYDYNVFCGVQRLSDDQNPPPVSYPYYHPTAALPQDRGINYLDWNQNGVSDLGEQLDPAFFQGGLPTQRATLSGFAADGLYESPFRAGTFVPGGDHYRLKVIETNAQLNLNFIGETPLDILTDELNTVPGYVPGDTVNGTAFKFMLLQLGAAIQEEITLPENPFNYDCVRDLWDLRLALGGQFTSKYQIRDVVIGNSTLANPEDAWRAVENSVTVHAWPGHDPRYTSRNPNTLVPEINTRTRYEEKIGSMDYVAVDQQYEFRGKPHAVDTRSAVLCPVNVNTASGPVMRAVFANVSGDARFWYFSVGDTAAGTGLIAGDPENAPGAPAFSVATIPDSDIAQSVKHPEYTELALWSDTSEDQFGFGPDLTTMRDNFAVFRRKPNLNNSANILFRQNPKVILYLQLDPLKAPVEDQGTTADPRQNYAANFTACVEALRPFHNWADFDKRVIQDIVIANHGVFGGAALPSMQQIVEPFDVEWRHPFNKTAPGGAGNPYDGETDYLREWYYEAVADLLRAAFNPTPKITKYNPDANYYQRVDRSDLLYYTVPLCFHSPGIFEVTALGQIYGNVYNPDPLVADYEPRPIVKRQLVSVVKVADIMRHHSQRDFTTGVPNDVGDFKFLAGGVPDPGSTSITRLMRNPPGFTPRDTRSCTTTFPRTIDEHFGITGSRGTRVNGHVPTPHGDNPEALIYDTYMGDHVNGFYPVEAADPGWGYISLRAQDVSPLEPWVHDIVADAAATPFEDDVLYMKSNPPPPGATPNLELNFFLPFNESLYTVNPGTRGWVNNPPTGNNYQTARYGSAPMDVQPDYATGQFATQVNQQPRARSLCWFPDGFLFRASDYYTTLNQASSTKLPSHLVYPTGVGAVPSASGGTNGYQTTMDPADLIDNQIPADYVENYRGGAQPRDDQKADQDMRQDDSNFPYYEGTVEFWYKSDVDQYDTRGYPGSWTYNPDNDRVFGGFFSANVMTYVDTAANVGIEGCQTFMYKEMKNHLRFTRIYYMNAIRGTTGAYNDYIGAGALLSDILATTADVVADLDGYASPVTVFPPGHAQAGTPIADGDHDPDDLGFMFARYEHWVYLSSRLANPTHLGVNANVPYDDVFVPHQWYHVAVSFRSDAETKDPFHGKACNFFINGVKIDEENQAGLHYPSGWDSSYWNDAANLGPAAGSATDRIRALSCLINEVEPKPVLVIGAVRRRQTTEEARQAFSVGGTGNDLTRELFYFADGEFVAPCNGTMDTFRVTNKYIEDGIEVVSLGIEPNPAIQRYGRYNTLWESGSLPAPNEPLGSYQNGFTNRWGRDVRVACINWNEYRPVYDPLQCFDVVYDSAPYCRVGFETLTARDGTGVQHTTTPTSPFVPDDGGYSGFKATEYAAPTGGAGVTGMGIAFPASNEFVLPRDGALIYDVDFCNGDHVGVMCTAIFDDITVTVLIPIEFLQFEEVYDF